MSVLFFVTVKPVRVSFIDERLNTFLRVTQTQIFNHYTAAFSETQYENELFDNKNAVCSDVHIR